MHMVDDATGTVLCQFSAGETTWAAAHLLRAWIERYGVRALYTDWKNVYVRLPNVQERLRGEAAVTQFGQMCAKLGIGIIAASSPQAKGRVERVHGTHQDRLVKKLRLATVSNYDDANAYLQEHYIAQHNRHYARPAAAEADYHRQRPTARQLDDVFWLEEERVLSEDWVVRYKNRLLQLARQNRHWARRLRAECGCGRTSQDTSSFTIADRACRFAKFPWLLLRRGAEEGALPLPLQPHPRNLRLRQAGLIALLPAIILGDKAGRIWKLLPSLPPGNQGTFLLWTN